MNRYNKSQSTLVLQVLTSIIDEMSEEQHEALLDRTIIAEFITKESEPIFHMFKDFVSALTDKQYEAILNKKGKFEFKFEDSTLPNINIEISKQNNDFNIDEILNKIKSSDRNSAKVILLDTNIGKELCLDILNNLNIKSSTRCKKETLVNKILDNIFKDDNDSIYDDIAKQLESVETREQARKILTDSKLKVAELKKLASIMKISLTDKTKDRIIYSIVQRVIGNRLDTEAIMNVKLK